MSIAEQSATPKGGPFDAVADEYDARFTNSLIGRAQRESVWLEMDRLFRPGQRILDINCGTGVDALHLAARGIHVVACDASPEMVAVARRRLEASPCRDRVDLRILAIEQIGELEKEGPYDGVLSNFAGLNCVADLRRVAHDLARLVRPGGKAILCLFGRLCLWEMVGTFSEEISRRHSGGSAARVVVANLAPGHSMSGSLSLRRIPSPGLRAALSPGELEGRRHSRTAVVPGALGGADLPGCLNSPPRSIHCSADAPAFAPLRITLWWSLRGWRYEPAEFGGASHRRERSHAHLIRELPILVILPSQPLQLPVRDVRHLEDSAGPRNHGRGFGAAHGQPA